MSGSMFEKSLDVSKSSEDQTKCVLIHSYPFDAMLFSFDLVNEFFQKRATLRMLEFLCREPLKTMNTLEYRTV